MNALEVNWETWDDSIFTRCPVGCNIWPGSWNQLCKHFTEQHTLDEMAEVKLEAEACGLKCDEGIFRCPINSCHHSWLGQHTWSKAITHIADSHTNNEIADSREWLGKKFVASDNDDELQARCPVVYFEVAKLRGHSVKYPQSPLIRCPQCGMPFDGLSLLQAANHLDMHGQAELMLCKQGIWRLLGWTISNKRPFYSDYSNLGPHNTRLLNNLMSQALIEKKLGDYWPCCMEPVPNTLRLDHALQHFSIFHAENIMARHAHLILFLLSEWFEGDYIKHCYPVLYSFVTRCQAALGAGS
ncbi:hypothetical protein MMC17_002087 [Xylographa soralifera]|nr:hypothetical protein [Xylographa soralifera]